MKGGEFPMAEFSWEVGRFDEAGTSVSEYLCMPIAPDPRGDCQYVSAFYARLAALLGEVDEALSRVGTELDRKRNEFGEQLSAEGTGKVSEALIDRKFPATSEGLRLFSAKASIEGRQKRLQVLERGLRARHEAVLALSQRQIAEIRMST